VYRAQAQLRGRFRPALTALPPIEAGAELHWGEAQMVVRLSDAHAIDEVSPLIMQKTSYAFEPGGGALAASGLHARLASLRADAPAEFELALAFRGSDQLHIAPSGLDTNVTMKSGWPDPAFQGAWLPVQREVGATGFTAQWHVPYVARGLPASWKAGTVNDEQLTPTLFGTSFVAPIDAYRMAERSLKYSPLFIGLAFLLVWLFEVVGGARVHPIQYLILGAALCLFYLLELSLAEHLGFGLAYVLASAAVTTQVTLYSRSALGGGKPLVMGAVTSTLYGLLYLLLREDDYALLVGSLSLFAMLSAVMFLTRRVQWSGGEPSGEVPPAQRSTGHRLVGG
jgi:inner membrane protein